MQLLARALGKNHEEAAIVLHLVLQNILICNPPTQQGPDMSVCVCMCMYIWMCMAVRWHSYKDTGNKGSPN